jgi:RHS repeat-associated protein
MIENGITSDKGENGPSAAASPFTPPQVSLPKGGGAIRGIGEKFAANPATGTGSLTVPIATSPGRSGFGPQLSLQYDSGIGNGPFGLGWNLGLPSITRRTDKGLPRYNDLAIGELADTFIISGAEDLVPVLRRGENGDWIPDAQPDRDGYRVVSYRPRTEGLFARIERWTCLTSGVAHWRSISRDNILTVYGLDPQSRIADPDNPAHVFTWLISASYDDKGNAIVYDYVAENSDNVDLALASERNRRRTANRYLKRIRYGNRRPLLLDPARPGFRAPHLSADLTSAHWMFSVVFDYGDGHYQEAAPDDGHDFATGGCAPRHGWTTRADPFSTFRSGFEVRTYRLCRRALMFHHFPAELGAYDVLVKSTSFDYRQEGFGSFLERVVQAGHRRQPDGQYLTRTMPPLQLGYTRSPLEHPGTERFTSMDVDPHSLANLPGGVDGGTYRWLDLDGEGIAGILASEGGVWLYKHNLGEGRFGTIETVRTQPMAARQESRLHQLMDVAGDGNLDLVDFSFGSPGFYSRTLDAGWAGFRAFRACPVLDWNDANLRFVDLTGDGIADVLITEDDAFTWHASLLQDGFGPGVRVKIPLEEERTGPRAIFADPEQTIYLADMTGDGLSDIVRVRNGEVCYWPNRGYGRFAAKVVMDGAPRFDEPDLFDQRRVRLADTDGSGTTDILYLGRDGATIYLNLSGNALSTARRVPECPAIDSVATIDVADLLGRGTACLIWSSPLPDEAGRQLRYIDLMCGRKPHLLARIDNNLGSETRIDYASSTELYLADKLAGTPWATRLPFPVHVVRRIEIHDAVSRNRIVTRYSYHHGFYDGLEREFRGFGRVDQLDTEDFATFQEAGGPPAENWDIESDVPPVLTKTWFHTGVYLAGGRISRHMEHEYFAEPDAPVRLADTILPRGLTPFEAREACRALKGAMLRQEVYGLDGSDRASVPYRVLDSNSTILLLQPKADNRYAVFFTHPREAITLNFERNAADPRIGHNLTLKVDDYGNVLRSAAIGYQRRAPEFDEQGVTLATLTENAVTNAVWAPDAWRTPLPAEARTYQLTAPALRGAEPLPFALFETLAQAATPIPYEAAPTAGAANKRLIEHVRTLYRADDLTRLLPLGMAEALALPGEGYKQALTDGLLAIFAAKAGPEDIRRILASPDAAWRELDGDGPFWLPSGRVFYSREEMAPADELTEALRDFFLPRRFRDPFGHSTLVGYDEHRLAQVFTCDAVGNETRATLDYRVLQPHRLTDPNGNRSEARFDALGMLVGTALHGKPDDPEEGDSFDDFIIDPPAEAVKAYFDAADPTASAIAHLGTATTRIIYDLERVPVCAALIARETHVGALAQGEQTRVQLQFTYSDGFARIAQKRIQAEPGRLDPSDEASPWSAPRWVGTGAVVYNNKGKPVRQYEPFFTPTPGFGIERWGVSNVLFYDPVERIVATLHPNHTFEKTVFDAWRQTSHDSNDTVLSEPDSDLDVGAYLRLLPESDYVPTWYQERIDGALGPHERQAAERAARHADTPTTEHFDTLGRTFLSIVNNGRNEAGAAQLYETRTVLDIEGNQRAVIDALGRTVMRYDYDMLGTRLRQHSMEAGEHWMLTDAVGQPLRIWNGRDYALRFEYDQLHRSTKSFVHGGTPDEQHFAAECLYARAIFGDSAETGLTEAERRARNLRTRPYRQFDGAGVTTNECYDFKGNVLKAARQFTEQFRAPPDWASDVALEFEIFASATSYDALNREVALTTPDGSVVRPRFNDASLLEAIDVNIRGAREQGRQVWSPFVRHINYDAKGQRQVIHYGNGAVTHYDYERTTFRLHELRTTRDGRDAAAAIFKQNGTVQDLHYTYDPVGNITHVEDAALATVFHGNHRVDAAADYTYDPLYRLLEATGREHAAQAAFSFAPADGDYRDFPFVGAAHPHDLRALRNYAEHYDYDSVGNILRLRHHAPHGDFERDYGYESSSLLESWVNNNRLSHTSVRHGPMTLIERYQHDAHGNMTQMPHLPVMAWDFQDQLRETRREVVNSGTPEATCYVYDATGQRARKITLRQDGTRRCERYYLGGLEIFRDYRAERVEQQRETLHVMDDTKRIALVETCSVEHGRPLALLEPVLRYQFTNHLGSATLELNSVGALLTYEEYSPYGNSTFQAGESLEVSVKRYRYTGRERDEENGFCYHGARYLAPWLGRWTATDPAQLTDGTNAYGYVRDNPVRLTDLTGTQCDPTSASCIDASQTEDDQDLVCRADDSSSSSTLASASCSSAGTVLGTAASAASMSTAAPVQVANSAEDLLTFLHAQAGFETGAVRPPTFNPRSASPFGTAAHARATGVLDEMQQMGFLGSESIYSEVRVVNGIVTQIGGTPGGPAGSHNLDILVAKPGETIAVGDNILGGVPSAIGDLKYGGGVIAPKYGIYGSDLMTITGRTAAGPMPVFPQAEAGMSGSTRLLGAGAGVMNFAGGAFMLASIDTENDPGLVTAGKITSGTASLAGGGLEVGGALTASAGVVEAGAALSGVGLIVGAPIMVYEMRPRGMIAYDPQLADRAIAEGRNPFCAQCHGPGGALDPNNDWNSGDPARRAAYLRRLQWVDLGH